VGAREQPIAVDDTFICAVPNYTKTSEYFVSVLVLLCLPSMIRTFVHKLVDVCLLYRSSLFRPLRPWPHHRWTRDVHMMATQIRYFHDNTRHFSPLLTYDAGRDSQTLRNNYHACCTLGIVHHLRTPQSFVCSVSGILQWCVRTCAGKSPLPWSSRRSGANGSGMWPWWRTGKCHNIERRAFLLPICARTRVI
jgi:hypothetical protein